MCVAAAADSLRLSLGLLPSLGFCSGCCHRWGCRWGFVRVVFGLLPAFGLSLGFLGVVFGLLPSLGLSLGFLGVVFGLLRFSFVFVFGLLRFSFVYVCRHDHVSRVSLVSITCFSRFDNVCVVNRGSHIMYAIKRIMCRQ